MKKQSSKLWVHWQNWVSAARLNLKLTILIRIVLWHLQLALLSQISFKMFSIKSERLINQQIPTIKNLKRSNTVKARLIRRRAHLKMPIQNKVSQPWLRKNAEMRSFRALINMTDLTLVTLKLITWEKLEICSMREKMREKRMKKQQERQLLKRKNRSSWNKEWLQSSSTIMLINRGWVEWVESDTINKMVNIWDSHRIIEVKLEDINPLTMLKIWAIIKWTMINMPISKTNNIMLSIELAGPTWLLDLMERCIMVISNILPPTWIEEHILLVTLRNRGLQCTRDMPNSQVVIIIKLTTDSIH